MTVLPRMDQSTRERVLRAGAAAAVLGTVAVLLLAWLGIYLADPVSLPPGPDVSWYVWRAELLMAHPPQTLVEFEGPLGAFGGGYRVANPILLALLQGLGGVDRYQASFLITAGWSLLAALAVGGVAYRLWKTPSAFVVVALAAGGMFFRNVFLGFADNMLALLTVTAALLFLTPARHQKPARVALFVLVLASFFAHPPVAAVFSAAVLGSLALPAVLRLRAREGIRDDVPIALSVLGGAAAAFFCWGLGVWGPGRSFADAVNVPPFRLQDFLESAGRWVGFMDPVVLVPLLVVGLASCVLAWRRSRRDPLPRTVVLWLLPVLGTLGYVLGLRLPYHRFLGITLAPVLLAGLGLWTLAARPLGLAGRRRLRPLALLGSAIAIAVLVSQWYQAVWTYTRQTGWLPLELRPALAAVSAYLEESQLTEGPVVYVVPAGHRQTGEIIYARIWRGRWSRVRAGLPGEVIPDAYMYLGNARDFLRGGPAATGNPTFDRLSEASYREMVRGLRGRAPVAFEVRVRNEPSVGPPVPPTQDAVFLDGNAWLLRGPRLVSTSPSAVAAARAAAAEARA
ncbi:MAG TPA: hypothetical protein VGS09_02330, partial [Actinomycetota bacterium]|nr:hypothetical protein [Actinomycetota bacterium]